MHLSAIFNPVSLLWSLIMSVGTVVIISKVVFNSLLIQSETLRKELKDSKEKMERIERDNARVLEKDRMNEKRMLELEAGGIRANLQSQIYRDEIDLLGEILTRCLSVILPQANGSKAGIESKVVELTDFRKTARQRMFDFDEEQRIFRTFSEKG